MHDTDRPYPPTAPEPLWTRDRLLAAADKAKTAGVNVTVRVGGQDIEWEPAIVRRALAHWPAA